MKRYWIEFKKNAYKVLASTLTLNVGERVFVNGVEVTVVGDYKGLLG